MCSGIEVLKIDEKPASCQFFLSILNHAERMYK